MAFGYRDRDVFEQYGRLINKSRLKRIRDLGHDILEVRCEGSWIYGADGKRYIDCIGNEGTFNLGRRPTEVVAELKRAIHETDQGNFPMISGEKAFLAQKLSEFVPGNLPCVVFSVVRGETVDFACKLARGYTHRQEIVCFEGAWHGHTGFALSLSDRKDKENFGPLIPGIRMIKHGNINEAARAIGNRTAAVIVETIQAENSCRVAEKNFLYELRRLCDHNRSILIFDETQSGMGRSGRKFCFEYSGISPDVLIIGEAMGAGVFPIAATVFSKRLNRFMNRHPLIHLSTFGGTDVGCRVAMKALEVYEMKKPWANAMFMGKKLAEGLEYTARLYPDIISSVTGMGLLVAVETGSHRRAVDVCRALSSKGVLAAPGTVARGSIVFRPSLLITEKEVNTIVDALSSCMKEI